MAWKSRRPFSQTSATARFRAEKISEEGNPPEKIHPKEKSSSEQVYLNNYFPNAVVLNAVGRRNTQMRAKEPK